MLPLIVLVVLSVADAQNICCVPRQWEGVEGSILGAIRPSQQTAPQSIEQSALISYDAINQRIAATMTAATNLYSQSVKMILDFRVGVQYTIDGNTCIRTSLGPFREACIPAGTKNIGSTYFGAGHSLNVTTYEFDFGGGYMGYATVTTDGCVPVTETLFGSGASIFDQAANHAEMQVLGYSNITPGIQDTSVFSPPASCANSPLIHSTVMQSRRRSLFGV